MDATGTPMDEALKQFLERLEQEAQVAFSPGSFQGRLRIQKVVYLLQAMGETAGRKFGFSVYYRGPYSPMLAKAYYGRLPGSFAVGQSQDDIPPETIKALAQAADQGNDFLEAASTLHAYGKRPNYGKEEAMNVVERMKPHLDIETIEAAWGFLSQHGLVGDVPEQGVL